MYTPVRWHVILPSVGISPPHESLTSVDLPAYARMYVYLRVYIMKVTCWLCFTFCAHTHQKVTVFTHTIKRKDKMHTLPRRWVLTKSLLTCIHTYICECVYEMQTHTYLRRWVLTVRLLSLSPRLYSNSAHVKRATLALSNTNINFFCCSLIQVQIHTTDQNFQWQSEGGRE